MKKKILVSVPNTGFIHKMVTLVLLKLQHDPRYDLKIIMPTWRPYEHNLHRIVRDFIKDNCHFWLNIDSDNPPLNNPLDLVELERDIIGLPTPVWHYTGEKKGERPYYHNVYRYDKKARGYKEYSDKEGLQRVDAVGTGCILISKRVFLNSEMQKSPFSRKYDEEGIVTLGNDLAFCERAARNGFEVYAHYGYPCDHFNELSMNEMIVATNGMVRDGTN